MTERLSKSAIKRQFKEEEQAAQELSLLSDRDLQKLPAEEEVKKQIIKCRGLKGGALKRQVKYLAKVMRDGSVVDILNFLSERKGSELKVNRLHREAEKLRDRIVDEAMSYRDYCLETGEQFDADWPGDALKEIVEEYGLDEVDLRRTVFQFARTRVHNYYREVFRIVKAGLERSERLKKLATN